MAKNTSKPCSVERHPRQVIENQLLARLEEDKSVVAILANQQDLGTMIAALRAFGSKESEDMAKDLKQLHDAAFNG